MKAQDLHHQFATAHIEQRFPGGIPQSSHGSEYPSYFKQPIKNTGSPYDPQYWADIDRQLRLQVQDPTVRIRQESVNKIKTATEERSRHHRASRPHPYKNTSESGLARQLVFPTPKNPRLLEEYQGFKAPPGYSIVHPEDIPPPSIQHRRRNRRQRRQVQCHQDFTDLDFDAFRQASLNQLNSADALKKLKEKYPKWY